MDQIGDRIDRISDQIDSLLKHLIGLWIGSVGVLLIDGQKHDQKHRRYQTIFQSTLILCNVYVIAGQTKMILTL